MPTSQINSTNRTDIALSESKTSQKNNSRVSKAEVPIKEVSKISSNKGIDTLTPSRNIFQAIYFQISNLFQWIANKLFPHNSKTTKTILKLPKNESKNLFAIKEITPQKKSQPSKSLHTCGASFGGGYSNPVYINHHHHHHDGNCCDASHGHDNGGDSGAHSCGDSYCSSDIGGFASCGASSCASCGG